MSVPENSRIWALHGYGQSPSMLLKALDKVKSTWYRQHDGKVPANQQVIAPEGIFVPPFATEARERLASGEQFADDNERQKLVAAVSLRGWWFLDYEKMKLEPPVLVVPSVDQMMAVLQEGNRMASRTRSLDFLKERQPCSCGCITVSLHPNAPCSSIPS